MHYQYLLTSFCFWGGLFTTSFIGLSFINYLISNKTNNVKQITNENNDKNNKDNNNNKITIADRIFLCSRICSIIHAIGATALSAMILLDKNQHWTIANTSEQQNLLAFSLSYFIYDIFYMAAFEQSLPFTIHHILTIGSIGSSWILQTGGFIATSYAFFGEISNPLQLVWTTAKRYKYDKVCDVISPIFTWTFIPLRCLIMPTLSFYFIPWIWTEIPTTYEHQRHFWIFMIATINLTGFWWSYLLYNGYHKHKYKQIEKIENKKIN